MVAVAMLLTAASCGDDDSSESTGRSFDEVVEASIAAENDGDVDAFLALWTDDGLASYDSGTREEIAAGEGDLTSGIDVRHIGEVEAEGKTARVEVDAVVADEATFVQPIYRVVFVGVQDDGAWLIDGFEFLGSPPPSSGDEVVRVTALDYEFRLDRDTVPAGKVAFRFENEGKEPHEIALYKGPEGVRVEDAKAALENVDGGELEDVPDGYEVAHIGFAEVGQAQDLTFLDEFEPGTYVLVCYIPQGGFGEDGPVNEDGRPHVQLGMIEVLTVT